MLSDNSEKTRNPLKKAMRRRNAKTVQFAAPTYVEASDYDYSSDEEDAPTMDPYAGVVQSEDAQQTEHAEEEPVVEKTTPQEEGVSRTSSSSSRASFDREQAASAAAALSSGEEPQLSPKLVDKTEAAPLKSRRTRNTDSFLKDDTIETRKITLTPGLLREEGKDSMSTDSTRNASLENLVKQVSPPESINKKDTKKEKEKKKGGLLGGLFKSKKKDKKSKEETEMSDAEKISAELMRNGPGVVSPTGRGSPIVDPAANTLSSTDTRRQEVQTRQPTRGKLQKPQPTQSGGSSPSREVPPQETQQEATVEQPQQQPREFVAELQGSEAAHEMASAEPDQAATADQPHLHTELALQDKQQKDGPLSPITNMLKRDDSKTQKPVKAKKSKERMELDDFDSPDGDEGPNPFKEQEERAAAAAAESGESESFSDSPVEITQSAFMHGTDSIHIPTPGFEDLRDDSDEEEPESLTTSPSIIEHPDATEPQETSTSTTDSPQDDDPTPTGPRSPEVVEQTTTTASASDSTKPPAQPERGLSTDSTNSATTASSSAPTQPSPTISSASQQTWSDASLRAWLEDGSEVKDMMVMIYDKSGVVPVGEDHPLMQGLFTEQRKGVQDMMGRLDGLLGGYLERRGIVVR